MLAQGPKQNDLAWMLALCPPLLVRLYADGADGAVQRLALVVFVFGVAYMWNAVFKRRLWVRPEAAHIFFALLFAVLLPGPVGWGGAFLAISFGWVFGHEIFGGRGVLSPALLALVFAIFSFPEGGFEHHYILYAQVNPMLALSCVPGGVWLVWKKVLAWRVFGGVALGVALTVGLLAEPSSLMWQDHLVLGTFSVAIVFIGAAQDYAPRILWAGWIYGALIGALIVVIRLANPDQPDGVAFALLLGGLFAPLIDRMVSWGGHDAQP